MEKTLAVINQLEQEGLVGRYAIGGAIAATRYIEPIQTYDLDIFVSPSGLISISPIYTYLTHWSRPDCAQTGCVGPALGARRPVSARGGQPRQSVV